MAKHDYTALDRAILRHLKIRPADFHTLESQKDVIDAATVCHQIEQNDPHGNWSKDRFRFIDGRLQALRSKGLIVYSKTHRTWSMAVVPQ